MKTLARVSFACVLSACALDLGQSTGVPCASSQECPPDRTCYRAFCVVLDGAECAEEGMEIDCYTGGDGSVGVGACRPGRRTCRSGVFSSCRGEIVPGLEVCNAADDDCDGRIDEISLETSCSTGLAGACAEGATACVGPSATCVPVIAPGDETCDGTDDDCDGRVDEIGAGPCYPAGALGCTETDGAYACEGICRAGTTDCVDGAASACTGAVVPAATDGCTAIGASAQDDDCDGRTDEDCACPVGSTQPCYDGPAGTAGVGPCVAGAQRCELDGTNARYGPCTAMRAPSEESCSNPGVDDDCNGAVDDVPGRAEACVSSALGLCHTGVRMCTGSALTCVTAAPRTELCDGLDDDCDGRVDEGFALFTDPRNCGACGHSCGTGLTCCAGACVDLATSAGHCGSCTTACGMGVACCSAVCTDLDRDAASCGSCGHRCGAAETCSEGLCCAAGALRCGGTCVDPRTDERNCGRCGLACNGNETCTASCCCRADGRCRCS